MMLVIKNKIITVSMKKNGTDVIISDNIRKERFVLDEKTRYVSSKVERFDDKPFSFDAVFGKSSKVSLAGSGKAEKQNKNSIVCTYKTKSGNIKLTWILEEDRLRVFADCNIENCATALTLPGTFRLEKGKDFTSAVPNGQGILHTGKGIGFYRPLQIQGHSHGRSLDMFAQTSGKAALITITESDSDAVLHWEKTSQGKINLMWVQHASMGKLSYTREAVLMFTPPDITSICKKYRAYEIEKDRFKTWEEKIKDRPNIENIFGACRVFLGYQHDEKLDYLASFKKLKKMGIDKAIVYPVYFGNTQDDKDFKKNGIAKWTDLRKIVPDLQKMGYSCGSFIYIVDGPVKKGEKKLEDFALDNKGKPILHWEIKALKWFVYSNAKRFSWARRMIENESKGLEMVHYDVLTTTKIKEDYNSLHICDARGDTESRKKLLEYTADKKMYISSEGFWGRMTKYYDIGNTKYYNALGGDEYCVVPMTMLVYHDSAYQTWWEVDNYNNPEHQSQWNRGFTRRFNVGGGHAHLQACSDALMGVNPDIFPFGKQYNFVPHSYPENYYYSFRLEQPEVREAIELAKPVMKLNKKIGKLEMVDFKLHRADGSIQESVFADGTRVIANFANVALEAPKAGLIQPETWITL